MEYDDDFANYLKFIDICEKKSHQTARSLNAKD